jgi:hypothetical protein
MLESLKALAFAGGLAKLRQDLWGALKDKSKLAYFCLHRVPQGFQAILHRYAVDPVIPV